MHDDNIPSHADLVTIFNLLQQAQQPIDDWLPEREGPTIEEIEIITLKQLGFLPD